MASAVSRRLCHRGTDLAASRLCSNLDAHANASVDDMAKLYSEVLTELLDHHCPAVKVRRKAKEKTPWYDADCRAARRQARAAERRFRRSHREDDRLTWMGLLRSMGALYEDQNTRFWREEIATSKGDSSKLWRTFKGVLGDAPPADSDVLYIRPTTLLRSSTTRSTPFEHLLLRRLCTMCHTWTTRHADHDGVERCNQR